MGHRMDYGIQDELWDTEWIIGYRMDYGIQEGLWDTG